MPVTAFHFGPGAALHAIAPKHVSFIAFCTANVVIDLESGYNLLTQQYPVHAFMHTYVGATLAAVVTVLVIAGLLAVSRRVRLPNVFEWQALSLTQVVIGAAAGAYSHIVLDSIMHGDMTPLAPFTRTNDLLALVSIEALHWFCAAVGLLAVAVIAFRLARTR